MDEFKDEGYERDYPRENISVEVEIGVDGIWYESMIVNISPSGAKLSLGLNLDRGKDVVIQLGEFGEFNATVAWSNGEAVGVKFDHDPLEMTRVLIGLTS